MKTNLNLMAQQTASLPNTIWRKACLMLAGLGAIGFTQAAEKPNLTVYTYDLFAAEWGAGPKIKQDFEAQCGCEVKYVVFDNAVTLFNRLKLEGAKNKADVVVGLDGFSLPEASKSRLFTSSGIDPKGLNLPMVWQSSVFVPFDYGQFAFIYDKNKVKNPPKSLKELVERQDLRVIYQDPRSSTVGRGLLVWMNQVFGAQTAEKWKTLTKHTVTVGKGWTESYGAFLKGESDLVLSYNTSPSYHIWSDKKTNYAALEFAEGHLTQLETAAVTRSSKQPKLAADFIRYLLTPAAQESLTIDSVMLPVTPFKFSEANKNYPLAKRFKVLPQQGLSVAKMKEWQQTWRQNSVK